MKILASGLSSYMDALVLRLRRRRVVCGACNSDLGPIVAEILAWWGSLVFPVSSGELISNSPTRAAEF